MRTLLSSESDLGCCGDSESAVEKRSSELSWLNLGAERFVWTTTVAKVLAHILDPLDDIWTRNSELIIT